MYLICLLVVPIYKVDVEILVYVSLQLISDWCIVNSYSTIEVVVFDKSAKILLYKPIKILH